MSALRLGEGELAGQTAVCGHGRPQPTRLRVMEAQPQPVPDEDSQPETTVRLAPGWFMYIP